MERCRRILGYSVLAGLAVMVLSVGSQFLGTGIEDSTLLIIGFSGMLGLTGGGIIASLLSYLLGPGRPGALRIPGVHIKALDWPGPADQVPREGPIVVVLDFANPEYARRFEELNGPPAPPF